MGEKNNAENKNDMHHQGKHTGRMTGGNMDKIMNKKTPHTGKCPKGTCRP